MALFPFNYIGPGGSAGAAADPDRTIARTVTRDTAGAEQPGVTIAFRLTEPPDGDTGNSYAGEKKEVTSDADGLLQVSLLKNAWYVGRRGQGEEVAFLTGAADAFTLPNLPSRPDPL